MLKEFKSDIAKMYSLMGRMGKHMTLNESSSYEQYLLNEANGTDVMYPKSKIQVIEDKANKVKKVLVTISHLAKQDIYKILHSRPFSTEPGCVSINMNGVLGIRLSKELPYREIQHRVQQDPSQQASQTDPQQQSVTSSAKGLKARLKAKKQNGQAPITEGLKSRLQQKHQQDPSQVQASSQVSAVPQSSNSAQIDPSNKVYAWLKKFIDPLNAILSQNPLYDKASLDEITAEELYASYIGTVSDEESLYPAQSIDRLKKEIAEAIKNGNWVSVMPSIMTPVNLNAVLYGNVLKSRNVTAINFKASDYGLSPNDPDYPTLVLCATEWLRYFRRRIKPGARRYPIIVPGSDDTSKKKGDMGTKQHMANMGTVNGKYFTKIGFDVSDTEPIDPTDPRNYIDDQAGLTNNIRGELNILAVAEKNANMASKLASLSQQQQQVMSDTQTAEGQSRYWNEGLIKSVKILGLGLDLPENINVPNPIQVYAENMTIFASKIIEGKGITKPQIKDPMVRCIAFGLACKTLGQQEVLNICKRQFNSAVDLASEWNTYADQIVESIKNIFKAMVDYLEAKYKGNLGNVPTSSNPQASQQQVSQVSENTINKLEYLLEKFV